MPAIPKLPGTPSEYKDIVEYLKSKKIPETIHSPSAKCKFTTRCSKFELDENEILYLSPVFKNNEVVSDKRRVVPRYDTELRSLLLKNFHDQFNHRSYHKTFSALSEKHIGITQTEVQAYINECSVCAINTSIKEKTDMKSVISVAPWRHIQIDLIDFHDFSSVNYGFAWSLTCVCTFSKFLIAVPMKNKEAGTVAAHLVKDVFRILGPPTILQSDNGKEFEGIVKQVCEILNIKIKHGHPRHL